MVNRLKSCIDAIIGHYQTGLIPSRSIPENILVAREFFHSMNRMKGKVSFFVVNVDLEKAYEKI